MKRNITLIIGLISLFFLLFTTLAGPYLPFIDQELKETPLILLEPEGYVAPPFPFTMEYPLGSDDKGRDLLSLIVLGMRDTLWVLLLIVLLRYAVAIPLAAFASIGERNPFGWLITKWNNMLSYLPVLVIAILYLNIPFVYFSEERKILAIVGLALIEVGRLSHLFQEEILDLSKQEYVKSGIVVGNSGWGLFRRYYWPALRPHLFVNFMQDMGKVMLLLGQLGFLGIYLEHIEITLDFGIGIIANESIALPQLLGENKKLIITNFFIPFAIAAAITWIVLTFYWLGEGLRKYYQLRNHSIGRKGWFGMGRSGKKQRTPEKSMEVM